MLSNSKKKLVRENSLLWGEDVAESYHAAAASHMDVQRNYFIEPILARHPVEYTKVVDFACGYGRNTDFLLAHSEEIVMVDVNEHNLYYCRQKYAGDQRVSVIGCNGYDLRAISDASITFLYTFDSVVHFPPKIVKAYMPEFSRVLTPGAYAFIHHSNYTAAGEDADFRGNPHWRNYMSDKLFAKMARSAGFEVVEQTICEWGGDADIDCISLLKKR